MKGVMKIDILFDHPVAVGIIVRNELEDNSEASSAVIEEIKDRK